MRGSPTRSGLVVLALVAVLVAAGGFGAPAGRPEGVGPEVAGAAGPPTEPRTGGETVPGTPAPSGPVPMARHPSGLELLTPSASPLLVGFHEASTPHAEELEPVGRLLADRNRRTARPPDAPEGAPYVVLASRGRTFAPTSSIDVAVTDGEPVVAPVTGTVLLVEPYRLYGRHDDVRIEIVPDGAPDLRVVLIHLVDVAVGPGGRVLAGRSVIAASGRRFPFASQIDEDVGRAIAHVHVEVQPIDAPRPFVAG